MWLRQLPFTQAATVCVMNVDDEIQTDGQFRDHFVKIFGQKVSFTKLMKRTTVLNDHIFEHREYWQRMAIN